MVLWPRNRRLSVEIEITNIPEGQEVSDADIEKHRQYLINESRNLTYIVLAIGWNFTWRVSDWWTK